MNDPSKSGHPQRTTPRIRREHRPVALYDRPPRQHEGEQGELFGQKEGNGVLVWVKMGSTWKHHSWVRAR